MQLTRLRSSYEERMQHMVPAEVKQVCNSEYRHLTLLYPVLDFMCSA